jgi:predicted DCC family thiol-disulfide oxidoreductase YuxK
LLTETFPVNPEELKSLDQTVAFFDGYCNLCSGSVIFASRRTENVKFYSLQSETGQKVMESENLDFDELKTFILIKDSKVFTISNAVLELVKEFGRVWKALATLIGFIPETVRDLVYRFVARNRFAVFGRRDRCMRQEDI